MKSCGRTLIAALVLGVASVASTPVSAQNSLPGTVSLAWRLVEAAPSIEADQIKKNQPITIAKAHADGLVALDQAAVRAPGMSAIPAGALFARSTIGTNTICEPGRRPGQNTIACLADRDGDGRFDHFGRVQTKFVDYRSSTSIGFLVGLSPVIEWGQLGSSVSATPVADVPVAAQMNLQLTLKSLKGGWIGRGTLFSLCAERNEGKNMWGAAINVQYCTAELIFPDGPGQQTLAFLPSGSLKLISIDKSSAVISLDPPKVGSVF